MMQSGDVPSVLGSPTSYDFTRFPFDRSEGPGFIEVCLPPNARSLSVPAAGPIELVSMTLSVSGRRTGSAFLDQYANVFPGNAQAARVFDSLVDVARSCTGSVTQPILEGDPITMTKTLTTGSVPGGGVWVQTSTVYSQKIVEGGRSKKNSADPGVDRELNYSVFTLAEDAVIQTTYNTTVQARATKQQAAALQRLAAENAERWGTRP